MKFNRENVSFGRHQTFALRFGWLPKAVQVLHKNPNIFKQEDATVELGVGRNMVDSMRYWLKATKIMQTDTSDLTDIGNLIFESKEGFDPYLEDEATIWLLHWLLASNPDHATSIYWFFNRFHKTEFTIDELHSALGDFSQESIIERRRPPENTIKADINVITRMYCRERLNRKSAFEDVLSTPFLTLGLVTQIEGEKRLMSRYSFRPSLPPEILMYAVLEVMQIKGVKIIPIEDLIYSQDGIAVPGSVFRLSESEFITKVEQLIAQYPNAIKIDQTGGLTQLFIMDDSLPQDFICQYYDHNNRVAA